MKRDRRSRIQHGPTVMKRRADAPDPTPGAGRRAGAHPRARASTRSTRYIQSGAHARKPTLPYTPGFDGAGEIERVGAGVTAFAPGDRVYVGGPGDRARRRRHLRQSARSARMLHSSIALPARVHRSRQGAALGVPYATAYRALCSSAPTREASETVLVHGATGGVGIASRGACARARPVRHRQRRHRVGLATVREHGADVTVNHRDAKLRRRDHGARPAAAASTSSSRWRRTSTSVAISPLLARRRPRRSSSAAAARSRSTRATRWAATPTSAAWSLFNATDLELAEIQAAIVAGLTNGTLRPVVGREMPLPGCGARARSGDGARRARQDRADSVGVE